MRAALVFALVGMPVFLALPALAQTPTPQTPVPPVPQTPAAPAPQPAILTPIDTSTKPPVSPRKAALLSLMAPGYGQIRLGRPNAAMLFSVIELFSIGMARKSAMDLAEARAARKDSVLIDFQPDEDNVVQPVYRQSRLTPRIKARRAHYEDWLSAIIFNHLFAAADAFVAANLWDLPANVSMSRKEGNTIVSASFSFR